jgi:hypothetical protein
MKLCFVEQLDKGIPQNVGKNQCFSTGSFQEAIRAVVVFRVSPKERAEETGLSKSSIDDTETMMKAPPFPAVPSL